jgi:hypothetical protein
MKPDLTQASTPRRVRRVALLLLVTVALSLFDLMLTLNYARSIGMIEANPIAAWIMREGCSTALIAWKFGSVGLAACIIYALRHRQEGELAAWVCALILVALTAHWLNFGSEVHTLTAVASDPANIPPDAKWIVLAD